MIKSELGSLNGWVYVDIDTSDVGGYVELAKEKVAAEARAGLLDAADPVISGQRAGADVF